MQIVSSKFSFVDFNDPPVSCNEEVMPIPAVDDFGIKFQFTVIDAPDATEFWVVPYINNSPVIAAKVQTSVICGVLARLALHADVPAIDLLTYMSLYDCYQYAVYDGDPEDVDSELLALSNPFQAVPASCWLSRLEYWSNENFADFSYDDTVLTNTVWLYMHLRSPTNPTKETRYIESSGKRRLLSAIMDEDYELKTDAFTQWLHRKIECALLHDYNSYTNTNVGLVDEVLSKNANYVKDWPDDLPGINIAPAKCRLIKNLSYTNSNCGDSECICTAAPVAIDYNYEIYKNETLAKAAGALMAGQTSDGTLTILPGTYDTLHGSITVNANGSFTYTPSGDYLGGDSFTYSIQNECGADIGTITINIKEMEPGFIMEWGGLPSAIPVDWLLCDGNAISRTTYAGLFAAIGTLHGPGNGTTTFNLPTIKKKAVVGYDAATAVYDTVGATGGSNSVTLVAGQMPKHKVKLFAVGTGVDGIDVLESNGNRAVVVKTNDDTNLSYGMVTLAADPAATIGNSSEVGNDEPVDITNAFVVLPYIIKI